MVRLAAVYDGSCMGQMRTTLRVVVDVSPTYRALPSAVATTPRGYSSRWPDVPDVPHVPATVVMLSTTAAGLDAGRSSGSARRMQCCSSAMYSHGRDEACRAPNAMLCGPPRRAAESYPSVPAFP